MTCAMCMNWHECGKDGLRSCAGKFDCLMRSVTEFLTSEPVNENG